MAARKYQSPYPWPWLTDVPLLRKRAWQRFILRTRHLLATLLVWPRADACKAWKVVERSPFWIQLYARQGTVPAGRCLLKVLPVNSQRITKLQELHDIWLRDEVSGENTLSKYRRAKRERVLREIHAVLEAQRNGVRLFEVRFFLNTLGRIDEHPWNYSIFVDVDSREIVSPEWIT